MAFPWDFKAPGELEAVSAKMKAAASSELDTYEKEEILENIRPVWHEMIAQNPTLLENPPIHLENLHAPEKTLTVRFDAPDQLRSLSTRSDRFNRILNTLYKKKALSKADRRWLDVLLDSGDLIYARALLLVSDEGKNIVLHSLEKPGPRAAMLGLHLLYIEGLDSQHENAKQYFKARDAVIAGLSARPAIKANMRAELLKRETPLGFLLSYPWSPLEPEDHELLARMSAGIDEKKALQELIELRRELHRRDILEFKADKGSNGAQYYIEPSRLSTLPKAIQERYRSIFWNHQVATFVIPRVRPVMVVPKDASPCAGKVSATLREVLMELQTGK